MKNKKITAVLCAALMLSGCINQPVLPESVNVGGQAAVGSASGTDGISGGEITSQPSDTSATEQSTSPAVTDPAPADTTAAPPPETTTTAAPQPDTTTAAAPPPETTTLPPGTTADTEAPVTTTSAPGNSSETAKTEMYLTGLNSAHTDIISNITKANSNLLAKKFSIAMLYLNNAIAKLNSIKELDPPSALAEKHNVMLKAVDDLLEILVNSSRYSESLALVLPKITSFNDFTKANFILAQMRTVADKQTGKTEYSEFVEKVAKYLEGLDKIDLAIPEDETGLAALDDNAYQYADRYSKIKELTPPEQLEKLHKQLCDSMEGVNTLIQTYRDAIIPFVREVMIYDWINKRCDAYTAAYNDITG